jgi:hypothetical protein
MTDTGNANLGVSFCTGDDFVKYIVSTAPDASQWSVILRGAAGATVQAERVPTGDWLSPYHQVTARETAWIVDSYLLKGEKGKGIEIRIPGVDEPYVIPYPYRDSPFGPASPAARS